MSLPTESPVIIQEANPEHADIITRFQLQMAIETESILLNPDITAKGVMAVFKDPSKGKYFIALSGNMVVGSLLITYEWSDWRNKTIIWLQSVYIVAEFRRRGIFRLLFQHLKSMIEKDDNIGGIRLYVDNSNIIAQETYTRLKMNGDHYKVFEWMK